MHGQTVDGLPWQCPCPLYATAGMDHARVTVLKRHIKRRVAILRLQRAHRLLGEIRKVREAH